MHKWLLKLYSKKSRAVIIYRVYRYIVKLSRKRYTSNSPLLIEMALSKYYLLNNHFLPFYTAAFVGVAAALLMLNVFHSLASDMDKCV